MKRARKCAIVGALTLPLAVWGFAEAEAKIRLRMLVRSPACWRSITLVALTDRKPMCCECLRHGRRGGGSQYDYDGDGLDDIFVTDSDNGKTNHLFHNNGNMTFTDVAVQAGVAKGNEPNTIVADALWFDYDNDGKEDLLVARFGTPILYHNEGGGKFKDVSATSGLNKFGNTIAVIAFDYENDGLSRYHAGQLLQAR